MNLMFYDFNGSSFGAQNNTAQNFFKPPEGDGEDGQGEAVGRISYRADGDRLPTRERGYRSANQNMRRRDMQRKTAGGQGTGGMQLITESDNSMQFAPHGGLPPQQEDSHI